MTEEKKKLAARTVRELYLYPYRTKGENVLRGIAWMASWLVGIVVQQTTSSQVLGGAYFIFALSLLLEFIPENRTRPISRIVHCLFCILPFFMLLGALVLSFGNSSTEEGTSNRFYSVLVILPPYMGWIAFVVMLGGVVLALVEAHKFFYDEEAQSQFETEDKQAMERQRFLDNLNGTQKGEQK